MFKRLFAHALAVLCLALMAAAPASALITDPTDIIPERTCQPGQVICTSRVTVNFSDPRIASGVWFATMPKGAYIVMIDAQVVTAFNAGTTNVITVGATTTANEVVASGITAGTPGIYHLTSAAGLGVAVTNNATYQTAINGAVPLYVKYTQTGTAATAGSVTIVIAWVKNDDN